MKSNCTYRKKFKFSAQKLPDSGKLRFKASFGGNSFVNKKVGKLKRAAFG